MSNDVKTVLLLCMSPYNAGCLKKPPNVYKYHFNDNKDEFHLEGRMTNEAPAKCTIECLKHERKSLDGVIMICSDKIRTEKLGQLKDLITKEPISEISDSSYGWLREREGDFYKKPLIEMTHREYFEEEIRKHDRTTNGKDKSEIAFEEIEIPNFTSDTDVAKSVVEAARKILNIRGTEEEEGTGIDLYIDFNGGQRYLAFTVINLANLMKIRNVNIKGVMNMNFENPVYDLVEGKMTQCTEIQNFKTLFKIDNLVSGINEYVNYGRAKNLSEYFKDSEDEEIKAILKEMKEFVNWLALCATTKVLEKKETLKDKFKEYKEKNKGEAETFKILFSFVVEDIEKGYQKMLEGDLPDMIEWCVEKDFIQQAITFYTDRMPEYFWESGIFRPTEQESREYEEFLRVASVLGKKDKDPIKKQFYKFLIKVREENKNKSFKRVWDIKKIEKMIDNAEREKYDTKELKQFENLKNEYNNDSRNHFKDAAKYYEKYCKKNEGKNKEEWEKYKDSFWMRGYLNHSAKMYKMANLFLKKDIINRDSGNDQNQKWFGYSTIINNSKIFDERKARARSSILTGEAGRKKKEENLKKILKTYFNMKDDRNQVNHADKSQSYDEIKRKLNNALNELKMLSS